MTPTTRTSIGSVEGTLLSLVPPYFHVRRHRAPHLVACLVPDSLREEAMALLGQRACMWGRIVENEDSLPSRIVYVERILRLREEHELVPLEQIGGSVPDLTGDLTTEEYFREIRGRE
jgi:hypothetical protein